VTQKSINADLAETSKQEKRSAFLLGHGVARRRMRRRNECYASGRGTIPARLRSHKQRRHPPPCVDLVGQTDRWICRLSAYTLTWFTPISFYGVNRVTSGGAPDFRTSRLGSHCWRVWPQWRVYHIGLRRCLTAWLSG